MKRCPHDNPLVAEGDLAALLACLSCTSVCDGGDAEIIAQYQRMGYCGITGFGTIAALSKALKLQDDNKQLKATLKDMYKADEFLTELADASANGDAAAE